MSLSLSVVFLSIRCRSLFIDDALSDELSVNKPGFIHFRDGGHLPEVQVEEIFVRSTLLGGANDCGEARHSGHLGVLALIVEPDVRLVALLGRHSWQFACTSAVELNGVAPASLDTQDNSIHMHLKFLAVHHADLLALANDFDRAVLHVEELEHRSGLDLVSLKLQSFSLEILDGPLAHKVTLFDGFFRGSCLFRGCGLGGCSLSRSCGSFLLLLGSSSWSTSDLSLEGSLGTCTVLLTSPAANVLFLGANKGLEGLNNGEVGFEPGLFGNFVTHANLVAVEKDL